MKKVEKREVVTEKEVCIATFCDKCNKQIIRPKSYSEAKNFHFYHVTTHHSDWGNDSIESYQYFDFCSMDCLKPHMNEYFFRSNGSEEYEISRESRTNDDTTN